MAKNLIVNKARTLSLIEQKLKGSVNTLPLIFFSFKEYKSSKERILNDCLKKFDKKLIVRSSSFQEDQDNKSNAGAYLSIPNVQLNIKDLGEAIELVFKSFGKNLQPNDEILVQPMLENVELSGVLFSSDIETLCQYYTINYDDSGTLSQITNGTLRNNYIFTYFKDSPCPPPTKFKKLIDASCILEQFFDNKNIDIEFAILNKKVYILQVRPLVKKNKLDLSGLNLKASLLKLEKKFSKLFCRRPYLYGNKTIYGNMPDWNPAEIIGTKPKNLSLSLYKELITDKIWAYQRNNYGYRNLRSHPLLLSFLGQPYIDVRVSFNSFLPKNLSKKIKEKLINFYIDKLDKTPSYHDKVEFKIVFSAYDLNLKDRLGELKKKGFSSLEIDDIFNNLRVLTENIISKDSIFRKDLEKIKILEDRYEIITNSNLHVIDKIFWLIEDCKRYGTLPFAGIARAAFIAVQILNSFVVKKIISETDKNNFFESIETISKKIIKAQSNLSKNEFLSRYGHLRPGSYDIESDTYDDLFDIYFSNVETKTIHKSNFAFSGKQLSDIDTHLQKDSVNISSHELIIFIREAIEGREYAKFIFTKNLSTILKFIDDFGKKLEINKEDLAHLDIKTIKGLFSKLEFANVRELLMKEIEFNKINYEYTLAVKLPSLIKSPKDIFWFYSNLELPSYITLKKIISELLNFEENPNINPKGKIVMIESADPGYDFLFTKKIAGLITCYGGANSHMSIRCSELSIPAAIGCGISTFNSLKNAKNILLDAENQFIKIIS